MRYGTEIFDSNRFAMSWTREILSGFSVDFEGVSTVKLNIFSCMEKRNSTLGCGKAMVSW